MKEEDVKRGLRVVIVASDAPLAQVGSSQRYVGHHGTVADDFQCGPDVLLDCGKLTVCVPEEIEPLPIAEESTVLDTAIALVKTKAAELAAAEQALLALIREGK